MNGRTWYSTGDAAAYTGMHPTTVRLALESGRLHGAQNMRGGRWRIHRDCLDAFMAGTGCPHRPRLRDVS